MKWKFIIVMVVALVLSGCAKSTVDKNNDLGSGDKSNLPISLNLLIEHAEYCKAIYDSGGDQKDEVAFDVKQKDGITIIIIRGTANIENVQSDIDVRLVKDGRLGIYLHKGFRDASLGVMEVIDAIAPLSEMFGYSTALRSISQGRASYTMIFHGYEFLSQDSKKAQ